jgi:hypothetical protein
VVALELATAFTIVEQERFIYALLFGVMEVGAERVTFGSRAVTFRTLIPQKHNYYS